MTRWEFRIVSCLAGGNASATHLNMLVMRFADVQCPAPLSLHSMFKAQYKCQVIIIIINICDFLPPPSPPQLYYFTSSSGAVNHPYRQSL